MVSSNVLQKKKSKTNTTSRSLHSDGVSEAQRGVLSSHYEDEKNEVDMDKE